MGFKNLSPTKKGVVVALVVSAVALAIFTYTYIRKEIDMVLNYCAKLSRFTVDTISLQKISFTVYLLIRNNSDIDIKIKSQDYSITANGYPVSTIVEDKQVAIAGRATYELPIVVSFVPLNVLKVSLINLTAILTDKDNIKIGIKGTFKGGSGIISVTYPIDEEYTIKDLTTGSTTESCWGENS